MLNFYKEFFKTVDGLTSAEEAGIETFATTGDSTLVPSMVTLAAGLDSEYRGITKSDLSLAYALAGAVSAGVESFDNNNQLKISSKDTIIDPSMLGIAAVEPGVEALVTVNPENVKMFTVAHNISIGKANQGLEEIMPVIMLGCGVKGIRATIELETIHESFIYDTITNKSKLKKVNAISLLRSGEMFEKFSTKVLPVKNADTENVLVTALTHETKLRNETFDTAPIMFDKEVNLLEITQTEGDLERGYNSDLTSISTKMSLDSVVLGDISDGDTANHWYVKVPLKDTAYANWVYSVQNDSSDFALSTTIRFKFDTDTMKVKLGAANDAVINPLAAATAGTVVTLDALVTGSGNGENGLFNVLISSIAFITAVDEDGVELTGTALTDLQTAFANTTGIGWNPDMSLSQEEMRTKGIITSVSPKTSIYMVGQTMPIVKYRSALGGKCEASSLESLLVSEAITYKAIVMYQALTAIDGLIAQIKGNLTTGTNGDDVIGFGIGRHLISPVLSEAIFNPSTDVRNITSVTALTDISGAFALKILGLVNDMNARSGYSLAKSNYESSAKTEIYVWAHASIITYLGNLEALMGLGNDYVVKVLAHHLDKDGKADTTIKVMFGTTNTNKTSELNQFQFGNMVISPSLVYDGVRAADNSTVAGTYTVPQMTPVINHPVIGLVHIENIAGMPKCCS